MSSSGAEMNADLREAKDFEEFFLEFQEKKQINWKHYEERMRTFLDRHYDRPGCREHCEQFDDSFAYLSPDIVHDVIELIDEPSILKCLLAVSETWGEKARKKKDYFKTPEFRWGTTVFEQGSRKLTRDGMWYDHHFKTLLAKASKLHGKLHLEELCAVSFQCYYDTYSLKSFYNDLNPVFSDVTLQHHGGADHDELVEPLRGFLVKQLQSSTLRRLNLRFNQSALLDTNMETKLLDFCLSDRFESLDWNCGTLSPEFFVQIYNAFKTKRCPPDCKTRQITAVFPSAERKHFDCYSDMAPALPKDLQHIQQALSPERTGDMELYREDRSVSSQDRSLAISIRWSDELDIIVCIELRHNEVQSSKRLSDILASEYGCYGDCEIQKINDDENFWEAEDCEDCPGCIMCDRSNYFYSEQDYEWIPRP